MIPITLRDSSLENYYLDIVKDILKNKKTIQARMLIHLERFWKIVLLFRERIQRDTSKSIYSPINFKTST